MKQKPSKEIKSPTPKQLAMIVGVKIGEPLLVGKIDAIGQQLGLIDGQGVEEILQ